MGGLSCCGAEGPVDWEHSHYTLLMEGEVREIGIGAGQENHHFSIPQSCCSDELVDVVNEHFIYILCAGLGLLLIELLGLSLSLCLCCTLARANIDLINSVGYYERIEARKA